MLLMLLACTSSGLIEDDTGPGNSEDGACMWICTEEFKYWETDYLPTAESECMDVAVEACGGEPYGTRWLEEYPEEVCCLTDCKGGAGVGMNPGLTDPDECAEIWDGECQAQLVVYGCDVY